MKKFLAWTCLGCALLCAAVSMTAIFAGEASGLGVTPLLYAAIVIAAIGMLMAVTIVMISRLD